MTKQLKYFSLFTGIGGFELGIKQSYVDTINRSENGRSKENKEKDDEERHRLESKTRQETGTKKGSSSQHTINREYKGQPTCVGYSEIDKYAIQIYQKHFPNHKNYGDITKINEKDLPDFDLLCGGFPCQSFSIAGKRKGFEDTRGTLFFDIARICRAKRPRLLLLENVKGLLSHDNGNTFATIIGTLDELGYDCQWQVLNSKNHGVPQNRERVLIVGHLRGTPRPEVFPIGLSNGKNNQAIKVGGYLSSEKWDRFNESSRRVYETDGISPTIPTVAGGGHTPKVLVREATKKGFAEAGVGDSINLSVPNSTTSSGRVGKQIAQTIDTGMQQYTLHPKPYIQNPKMRDLKKRDESVAITASHFKEPPVVNGIRRLTPVECERLQGFPDNWTALGVQYDSEVGGMVAVRISDTQRYKCCGNAVTVNVIRDVVDRMIGVKPEKGCGVETECENIGYN